MYLYNIILYILCYNILCKQCMLQQRVQIARLYVHYTYLHVYKHRLRANKYDNISTQERQYIATALHQVSCFLFFLDSSIIFSRSTQIRTSAQRYLTLNRIYYIYTMNQIPFVPKRRKKCMSTRLKRINGSRLDIFP